MSELNWIPRSIRKGIPKPIVVYDDSDNGKRSGYYNDGVITITDLDDDELIPGTIAHEYCHHLQYVRGINLPGSLIFDYDDYEQDIRSYFLLQPIEMEALLFSYKLSNNWLNEWWLKKLVLGS